jgi:hypothetical protein
MNFEGLNYMDLQQVLARIKAIEHGFKHLIEAGEQILSDPELVHFDLATDFLCDDSYQVRMLATYILGELSVSDPRALGILISEVAMDPNWRVQEMLAKAFDSYCQKIGYQQSLPTIKEWLGNGNPNVKRAVIEGLRIWTSRPYFRSNPDVAIALISQHKSDKSEYLRKSVGNALRDIGKKHRDLVGYEIAGWDLNDRDVEFTYKLVTKS